MHFVVVAVRGEALGALRADSPTIIEVLWNQRWIMQILPESTGVGRIGNGKAFPEEMEIQHPWGCSASPGNVSILPFPFFNNFLYLFGFSELV